MSCYTVDKSCGFRPKQEIEFQKNFLRNVIPTDISRFRDILIKKQLSKFRSKNFAKKFLSGRQKINTKNSLNARGDLSVNEWDNIKKFSELDRYRTFALLSFAKVF